MNVVVVGTGYVGLVSGTCLASLGNDVTCVDNNPAKLAILRRGEMPIYEPGLGELCEREVRHGRLHFTDELAVVANAEVVFLALPTPPAEDGSADLSYVLGVAAQVAPLLKRYTVIVDKSTVPVGTAERVRACVAAKATVAFDVVSNPEFLREGFALQDFLHPDRIVVGASGTRARKYMQQLYAPLTEQGHELLMMDERSAELTKYAANSFLAMKITFMNEIANLCERVGADIDMIRLGVGSDERIGPRFLHAGIGYGGSCFPKDVQALRHTATAHGHEAQLLDTVIRINTAQQHRLQEKVLAHYAGRLRGKTFALWGLAFKQNTDDIRQSPAIGIVADLTAKGATVRAYDPAAMPNAQALFADNPNVQFCTDEYDALAGADALLIATEWPQFGTADLAHMKKALARPVVFDGRNMFDLARMAKAGFRYESIGRPPTNAAAGT